MIKEAKLFKNGQSQAVRLPKEFRFEGSAVYINKIGDHVVLTPQDAPWKGMIDACQQFTDDFLSDREQPKLEERQWQD